MRGRRARYEGVRWGLTKPWAFLLSLLALVFVCGALLFAAGPTQVARAEQGTGQAKPASPSKVSSNRPRIRFGTVEQEGYSKRGKDGVVRGFDAEYVAKIAQTANFDLEYVFYDDFDSLLAALEAGEIDMAAGISQTGDRPSRLLFSENEIASGALVIRVKAEDDRYEYGNIEQIASMSIGVIKGSSMGAKAQAWADSLGISLNLVVFSTEEAVVEALETGSIDAMLSSGSGPSGNYREVFQLSTDKYYLAFNKGRIDLKTATDVAASRLLRADSQFVMRLREKWLTESDETLTLTAHQKEYLASFGRPLRVAVIENDAPFHTRVNGVDQGIVCEYYDELARALTDAGAKVSFEYVSYPNEDAAIGAVVAGKADIVGIVSIDATEALSRGITLTADYDMSSIVGLTLNAEGSSEIVESSTQGAEGDVARAKLQKAAVLRRDAATLASHFQAKKFPYQIVEYDTIEECYQAVQGGECALVVTSSLYAQYAINQNRSGLFTLFTISDSVWPFCGAVATSGDTALASALSQAAVSRRTALSSIIAHQIAPKTDFFTVLQRLPLSWLIFIFALILAVVLSIIYAVARSRRLKSKQRHAQELIDAQDRLIDAYEHDNLTKLANRDATLRFVNATFSGDEAFSAIMVSIDNVGVVNESYGHERGDQVLLVIARRIQEKCDAEAEKCWIARFGGKEFLVLLSGAGADEASLLAGKIFGSVGEPVYVDLTALAPGDAVTREAIWVNAHIGVASSGEGVSPEEVIQRSEMALEKAREREMASVCMYAEEFNRDLTRHNALEGAVAQAIADKSFYMVYQPKVALADNAVAGYEALVRMEGGRMSPGEFIPVAEESGFVFQIGRITTELVVRQIAAWRDQGKELRPVSINYSNMQLGDTGYLDYFIELLDRYDVPSDLVEIEITEGLLLKAGEESDRLFARLKAAGIRILIDDFGSGYSSLSYLSTIPVDVVKLDKSLVDAFLVNDDKPEANAFIRDVIQLVHDLGKSITVEGVEHAWQRELLGRYGCDTIQGYYFSRPLLPEEAIDFVVDAGA